MRQRDRNGKDEGKAQEIEVRRGGRSNAITTVNKNSLVMEYENIVQRKKT